MDIMPWDVMFQKLALAIATNTAPNLVLMGHGFMGEYIGENAIQPLDDIWRHTNLDKGDFVPEV